MSRAPTRGRRAFVTGLAAGLAGVAIAASAPGASAGPGPLVSCPALLECGRISVPLDHADPGAGRLALVVSRLRPKPGIPSAGALLFLTGGPGEAGIARDSAQTMDRLRSLSRNREVISVDLRGTGRSGALNCPTLQGPVEGGEAGMDAAIAACAVLLGPARRHYDTGQVLGDLEVVRQTLGIDRWAIGGVSYGTYVATRYARAHPDRVERLLLDSLVPPEGVSATGADSLAASRRIVHKACPRRSCGRISGALATDAGRLDARLAHGALPATVVRRDGTPTPARVGGPGRRSVLYEALLTGDVDPISRAAFPAAVRAALSGDGTLLARIVRQGQSGGATQHPTRQSAATQIASLCEDSALPWRGDTPAEARRRAIDAAASAASGATPQAPFSPFSVAELSPATLCVAWPEAPEPRPEPGPLPPVPTLVLAGGADIRTPQEGAYALASRAPGAEVVVVPDRGHSVLSRELECVETAVRRFFSDLPADAPAPGWGRSGRRCRCRPRASPASAQGWRTSVRRRWSSRRCARPSATSAPRSPSAGSAERAHSAPACAAGRSTRRSSRRRRSST